MILELRLFWYHNFRFVKKEICKSLKNSIRRFLALCYMVQIMVIIQI